MVAQLLRIILLLALLGGLYLVAQRIGQTVVDVGAGALSRFA